LVHAARPSITKQDLLYNYWIMYILKPSVFGKFGEGYGGRGIQTALFG